jgi:RNA polymerase sigma-70 factor, ECF subfamily
MPKLPQTRYSLLARLADADDAVGWSEFLEIYEGAVLRYCRSRGLQEADARDVVQEVLLAVHRAVGDWQPSGRPGSFRTWLLQTAHHICLKTLKRQLGRDRGVGGSSAQRRIEDIASADETVGSEECDWQRWAYCWAAGQVQREVQLATWRAFWMTAIDDQPPLEVAHQLGMRVGSVYAAKCRVLARIRERVQELSRSDR